MKRIFICILGLTLINATALMSMDDKKVIASKYSGKTVDVLANAIALVSMEDANKSGVTSPPATPRTPRTPHHDCACLLMARHCRVHPSQRAFDDGDHPLKSPKDQPRSGEIPSPKSASPSKLSLQTIAPNSLVSQSPDAPSQSNDTDNTQN